MGVNDREQERKINKRDRAKQARGRRASQAGTVDWGGFDWEATQALCEEMVAVGGAVRVGATRDGGAWALGIYQGDDYATEYIRPAEDFETAIREIVEAWLNPEAVSHWWERTLALRQMRAR